MDAGLLDGVHLTEQLAGEFDPAGAGALKATILGGQALETGSLGGGHRVELGLAEFTAREDPGGVGLAVGAMTGGFAALGAESVEGAWAHGLGSLELAEEAGEAAEIGPEALAELGEGRHVFIN